MPHVDSESRESQEAMCGVGLGCHVGRQFGEQSGMPDCNESTRYAQRDGPDLLCDIEGLLQFLGEWNQHVQLGVTWSESKLV